MTAPPPAGMNLAQRRWIGRLIRLGLVVVTIVVIVAWYGLKRAVPNERAPAERSGSGINVQRQAPTAEALGPGDAQLYSRDRAVNLILQGDRIYAGLSEETVAKIRAELDASMKKDDTSGIGGSIAQIVKKTVAENIGTHWYYPLADIRDIRLEGEEIVIERMNGDRTTLFGNTKVNNKEVSKGFDRAEAQRFIELVKARLRERG